jgi:hypothetical protein
VRFQTRTPDLRPALILDQVDDVAVNGFSVEGDAAAESVVRLIGTTRALFTATRLLTPAAVFLQVEGTGNQGIAIDGGDLSRAAQPLAYKNGAGAEAVKLRA